MAAFCINLGTEIFGAVVIFALLERFIGSAERLEELKKRYVRMMGSANNETALRGVAELDAQGWLRDGSLNEDQLGEPLDLRWANLTGVVLKGAKLRSVNLSGAILREAKLIDQTDLSGADLQKAILSGARMPRVILTDASFQEAHLDNAFLDDAQLQGADMRSARFDHTILDGALLQRVDFRGNHDLQRSVFLRGANLTQANLAGAKVRGTIGQINLNKAILRNANLCGLNLYDIDLQGANLLGANLKDVQNLEKAKMDTETILPDGRKFKDGVDLGIYTDSSRSDFWRSLDDPESPAYAGADGLYWRFWSEIDARYSARKKDE